MSESSPGRSFEMNEAPRFMERSEIKDRIETLESPELDRAQRREAGSILLEQLLREQKRFTSVFETEKGSYYFILHDGSSMRIQRTTDEVMLGTLGPYKVRPIADQIMFVDPSSNETVRTLQEFPGYALEQTNGKSNVILLTDLQVGAIPFEYGFSDMRVNQGLRAVFEIEGKKAIYVGTQENGDMVPLDPSTGYGPGSYPLGVTHRGHAVSRVVWPVEKGSE